MHLPKCRLLVALRYQEDLDGDLAADIRNIAEASAILQEKGVELIVQLKPSAAENGLPPPDVLAQLAPMIQHVKCSKLRTAQRQTEDFLRGAGFSAAHILALSNATTSLQQLCVSDFSVENWDDHMSDASMASIATFSCLTRLDLVCHGSPALQTLGQLSHLQKLALHLAHRGMARETCCEAVLLSNNTGLRKVQLDGHAWSNATYLALLTLTSLQVLTLSVDTISTPSAGVLGNVVAKRGMYISFHRSWDIADCALQGLTSSCANITSLQLDNMSPGQFQHVCTMEHLSSLIIVRPNSFSGFELVTQPKMSHLNLHCCHGLDTEGWRHIVRISPNLTSISMSDESQVPSLMGGIDKFVEYSQWRKLDVVNLSGLDRITADQVEALECAIRAQQELGLLQPDVTLILQVPNKMHPNGHCVQFLVDSSHHQVFSGTKPNEQLEVAMERYLHQQRVKHGAKLMLGCYLTATLVKGAYRFVARLL